VHRGQRNKALRPHRNASLANFARGTPQMVLKELGGWETIEMVQKYAHLAPSHVAAHAKTVMFWSQQEADKKKAA